MILLEFRWATLGVALAGVLIGGILIWVADAEVVAMPWSALAAHVGSFVIASVVMAVIFQFWQYRALLDDLFKRVRSAECWSRAGLGGFSASIYDDVPWDGLFKSNDRLRLMVAYARTWRNSHQSKLEAFVERPRTTLQVVLPDPDVEDTMTELGRRFNMTPNSVADSIREARAFFEALGGKAHENSTVAVYLLPRAPLFTFYLFSSRGVFATYRHRRGRGPIVTLLAERGGELYAWLEEEWQGIAGDQEGDARLVYPAQ